MKSCVKIKVKINDKKYDVEKKENKINKFENNKKNLNIIFEGVK